jgi:hypothetical protein
VVDQRGGARLAVVPVIPTTLCGGSSGRARANSSCADDSTPASGPLGYRVAVERQAERNDDGVVRWIPFRVPARRDPLPEVRSASLSLRENSGRLTLSPPTPPRSQAAPRPWPGRCALGQGRHNVFRRRLVP